MSVYTDADGISFLTKNKDILFDYEKAGIIHLIKIVRLVTTLVTATLWILACVSGYWKSCGDIEVGLWKYCNTVTDVCVFFNEDSLEFLERLTRILAVLSCLCALGSTCFSIASVCSSKSRGTFQSLCTWMGLCFMTASLVLFTTSESHVFGLDQSEWSHGWAYVVGWVAFSFSLVTWVVLFFLMWSLEEE